MIIPLAAGATAYNSFDWNEFIGTDWGVDASTRNTDAALERYIEHLDQMVENKGWPLYMAQSLAQKAKVVQSQSSNALDFWQTIANKEPGWMREAKVEPGSLPKYQSHIDFLRTTGAATAELERVLAEFSPFNVGAGVFKDTLGDTGEKIDSFINPKKSPWPWVAGGVVLLLLLRK